MALVEQAVFASLGGDRSQGYRVVANSPGLCAADARELVAWGPSHDALLEADAVSINFHPLPSGAYCVSRSSPAGWEYSSRGCQRVYTQCLIVPAEVLARFANNPLAIVRAAAAAGLWEIYQQVPSHLEPLLLTGGAAAVDQPLLGRLAADPGPMRMAALVQAALDSVCLAVDANMPAASLMAGLLNCLPIELRPEFSFSTGLKFSSRRPFRLVASPGDPAEQCWLANQNNVSVLRLRETEPAPSMPLEGWARLIGRILAAGQTPFLAAELAKRHCDLSVQDLEALGLQLLEDLDAASFPNDAPVAAHAADTPAPEFPVAPSSGSAACSETLQRAHAAHERFAKSRERAAAAKSKAAAPSKHLDANSPAVLEKLEYLDDLVYGAINGCCRSLEAIEVVWPEVLAELGDELVAESREEYLRYALAIWEQCAKPDGMRDAARAVQALDVLCVLFNDA